MKEKDINSIIRKSFAHQGDYAFKIPDSGSYTDGFVTHTKLPYDGYAYYNGKFIAWESKFLSKPMSLNLQRLEDHQVDALLKTKHCLNESLALFLVGIKWSSRETRIYAFKDIDMINERRNNKDNILKKEWEQLTNYVTVSKGLIDVDRIVQNAL